MKHITAFLVLWIMMAPGILHAQRDWSSATVQTTEVATGIYRLFVDNRVAVVAFSGPDGIMLIDAAYEQTVPQLKLALAEITDLPLRYLVNTHIHGDHTGGNPGLGQGVDIIAHPDVKTYLSTERRQGDRTIPPMPAHAHPNITFTDELAVDFNGQTVHLKHLPEGHTSGDIVVHFPDSEVLVVGDLLFADNFPFVDTSNGGHPMGYLNNVKWLIDQYPHQTIIIGGHGPVYTMSDYRSYYETLLQTVDVVRAAKESGMSASQMKENRILQQWESMGRFFITEDRWIDTLYPYL